MAALLGEVDVAALVDAQEVGDGFARGDRAELLAVVRADDVDTSPAELIALIKPQFEAGRTHLKKGVVRDTAVHAAVCEDVAAFAASCGWTVAGIIPSPIEGGERFLAPETSMEIQAALHSDIALVFDEYDAGRADVAYTVASKKTPKSTSTAGRGCWRALRPAKGGG